MGKRTAAWIKNAIRQFIDSDQNILDSRNGESAFGKPLIGFSRGDDPLFEEFKHHIGLFYWTPLDIFGKTFPSVVVTPRELMVISWILPQSKLTKLDNRREKIYPSERWARSKCIGEQVNVKLRHHLAALLIEAGHEAVAPLTSPHWGPKTSQAYGMASNWSERHAAFASGLGTFGLCDGLITPAGKAMRCGSVVARISVPPTQRPYGDHHEYCLFFSKGGICGICMKRCPASAITPEGHDKMKCRNYIHSMCTPYVKAHFNLETDVCGLCQTKVPCESAIPSPMKNL
ncbi:MAG: hypothetical protein A2169_02580 [Deltaproteobacteria bacterium RBG_13_47_9]|nr:MAG: hypothetical protein A2169_02580 [Deltaproteobacteria bacterium RBG_13_47_9]